MGSDVEKATVLEVHTPGGSASKKRPKRDCLCRVLNVITAICALLCLVSTLAQR